MESMDYFNYSKTHPEDFFDEYYSKNLVVIPQKANEENDLTKNHIRLIELISAFNVLNKQGKTINDDSVKQIVNDIVNLFITTPSINYSEFSQYFMVQNKTYSLFNKLNRADKDIFMYEMLKKYCENRHEIYLAHGYTHTTLQVLCDNYSHKRNSKTSIDKVIKLLDPLQLKNYSTIEFEEINENYYFLPDKGSRLLFENFIKKMNIEMKSREIEHNKLPDIVFKYKNDYYICELKTMKESGGGQNKQVVEISYFIRFSENNKNIHYVTFLDSIYYNKIIYDNSPKMRTQKEDIETSLRNNPQNYFFNTKSFIKFIEDIK